MSHQRFCVGEIHRPPGVAGGHVSFLPDSGSSGVCPRQA
jgi:hypothetical protein